MIASKKWKFLILIDRCCRSMESMQSVILSRYYLHLKVLFFHTKGSICIKRRWFRLLVWSRVVSVWRHCWLVMYVWTGELKLFGFQFFPCSRWHPLGVCSQYFCTADEERLLMRSFFIFKHFSTHLEAEPRRIRSNSLTSFIIYSLSNFYLLLFKFHSSLFNPQNLSRRSYLIWLQFVQLREFLPPHRILTDDDLIEAKYRLAKEVLQEVTYLCLSNISRFKVHLLNNCSRNVWSGNIRGSLGPCWFILCS